MHSHSSYLLKLKQARMTQTDVMLITMIMTVIVLSGDALIAVINKECDDVALDVFITQEHLQVPW